MRLRDRIKGLGFELVSRDVFAANVGELLHVVRIEKDRFGKYCVRVLVWHERFAVPGEPFKFRDLASPVQGAVGPEGVISSWRWADPDQFVDHIVSILAGFCASFWRMDDIREAVASLETSSPFWTALYGDAPSDTATFPDKRYGGFDLPFVGSLSLPATLERAESCFSEALGQLGYQVAERGTSIVFVKDRGEITDCVRFTTDLFHTFGQLELFPWSRDVWRVERRLKDRYIPITDRRTDDVASLWIRPVSELDSRCVDSARKWLDQRMQAQASIFSRDDFLKCIDPMYSTIRAQLAHLR